MVKYISLVQEKDLFAVADSLKRELDKNAAYKDARARMTKLGLTDFDISEIENANWAGCGWVITTQRDLQWPDHPIESVKRMIRLGLIREDYRDNGHKHLYFLTRDGDSFRENLVNTKPREDKPLQNVVLASPAANLPDTIETKTDINLSRDGLMVTVSKLFWAWSNGQAIKDYKMAKFVEEFRKGQEQIDDALELIATSEQRVSRMLIEQGPPAPPKSHWTEDMQRAQNDIYWMGGMSAFWLNPAGPLADPTPAPEWWSPPVDYKSLTMRHMAARLEDDVVARSLLAPVTGPKGLQGPPGISKPEWLGLFKNTGVVYGFNTQAEVDSFAGARKFAGEGYTIARRDSTAYPELYAAYVTQGEIVPALPEEVENKLHEKTKEMIVDELLAELEEMSDEELDNFEKWNLEYQEYGKAPQKIRTGSRSKRRVVENGNLFIVEHGNAVRGFDNKVDAEQWLKDQRIIDAEKAQQEIRRKEREMQETIEKQKRRIELEMEMVKAESSNSKAILKRMKTYK